MGADRGDDVTRDGGRHNTGTGSRRVGGAPGRRRYNHSCGEIGRLLIRVSVGC